MTENEYLKELLFSDSEIEENNKKHMKQYYDAVDEFKRKTSLTSNDMKLLLVAATLQTLRWVILSNDKFRFSKASDSDKAFSRIGKELNNNEYLPASVQDIALSMTTHTVPYDAVTRSDRYISIYNDSPGLSGTNHRYKSLGHDPLVGLIVGTANIATNTLTVNSLSELYPSYHVLNQEINGKTDLYHIMKWSSEILAERPEVMGAAFIRQIVHCGTDVFTKQGLPLPVINTISPEASKFLIGKQIDLYSTVRGAVAAIFINKLIEMCHRMYCKPNENRRLYDVRTRKILTYSNTLSSVINIGYVGITKNVKALDVGGILVTLWRILNDQKIIQEIQREFVIKTLEGQLDKEEAEVNQQLAKWGFSI